MSHYYYNQKYTTICIFKWYLYCCFLDAKMTNKSILSSMMVICLTTRLLGFAVLLVTSGGFQIVQASLPFEQTETSFHYAALNDDKFDANNGGEEFKYLVDVDNGHILRTKRDLTSIHQQAPLLRQFQKKNLVRIDTYELDNQKKRQLVSAVVPHQQQQQSPLSIMAATTTTTTTTEKDDEIDKSKGICLFANVNAKIGECFDKHNDCK